MDRLLSVVVAVVTVGGTAVATAILVLAWRVLTPFEALAISAYGVALFSAIDALGVSLVRELWRGIG